MQVNKGLYFDQKYYLYLGTKEVSEFSRCVVPNQSEELHFLLNLLDYETEIKINVVWYISKIKFQWTEVARKM